MKKIFSFLLAAMLVAPARAAVSRPKLVVGIVVDQMRWDYLYYLYDSFRPDGLRRLVDRGYSFENTMIDYVPTVTAIGHTSIYTGSVPALHGIAGNNFYIDGRKVYCCDDATVKSVGSDSKEGQMSPRNMVASGLGDVLKIHTDYKAKVVGVALKDRAAILPAGHAADAAYWWDGSAGRFISSTYYMNRLPDWAEQVNREIGTCPGTDVKGSVEGVAKTFRMASAALVNEAMGRDEITDLLAISVSSTDVIGHKYGTRHELTRKAYMELDKQVAAFLRLLDERVGQGNYLVFLSADHGAAHNPNEMKAHRIPGGGVEAWSWVPEVDKAVAQKLGISGKVILGEDAGRIYLDHAAIARAGKTLDEAKRAVMSEIEKRDEMLFVVDYDRALTTSLPLPLRERIVNGYNKKRSGDLFYVAKAGWQSGSNRPDFVGTNHGQWNPYDAHIPFVLYGWNVPHGQSAEPAGMVDIAPTICAMLHIQMPNSCVGNAKTMK